MGCRDYIRGLKKIKGHRSAEDAMLPPGKKRPPALRVALCAALGMGVLTACVPRLQATAAPSQPSVTLTDANVRLTILPNTWSGHPTDLGRYYTPLEIKIENDRTDEIQVRYGDFLAVDEANNQYRAVAPAEVAQALFSRRWRYGHPEQGPAWWAAPTPRLFAFHNPWRRYPYWPYRYRSPFFPPYDPYPYYPPAWPRGSAYDILTLGLREGRILPGARVEGFLYLEQATRKGNLLTLSWTPVAADGKPLTTFSSQFQIVR